MLCPTVPEEFGGLGLDFGYNAIVDEEMSYIGVPAGFAPDDGMPVGVMVSGRPGSDADLLALAAALEARELAAR